MMTHTQGRWHDGDTMLSFALFALIVFGMLAYRVADPANWIIVPRAPQAAATGCVPVVPLAP